MIRRRLVAIVLVATAFGCGVDPAPLLVNASDSGTPDAHVPVAIDSGAPDSGDAGDSGVVAATLSCSIEAGAITAKGDTLRTGWYSNQPDLAPAIVGGPTFGRLFKTQLTLTPSQIDAGVTLAPVGPEGAEAVLAQPLVFGSTVFVVTEGNNIYALDAVSGAITASRALGLGFDGSDVPCADLPLVGITGTPVIDPATGTAYFFSKTYEPVDSAKVPVVYAHAVDAVTLVERPNFPVEIQGTAANDSTITFDPEIQNQRTGLLLMDGVVYAGFGSHCDTGPYHGYIIGVGEGGGITTIFATEAGPNQVRGAGIWQAGGGLVSDGPGRILFTTANGYSNYLVNPTPGSSPPQTLDEAVVRLQVQADGSLQAMDFFTPYDAEMLDSNDLDFGSGGSVALPDCMAAPGFPHLEIAGGKEGNLYVLNRDDLGGFMQGPNGGDAYVNEVTTLNGVWGSPAIWPGDGQWLYLTVKGAPLQAFHVTPLGNGVPTLGVGGQTTDSFGYFSGSPIVTSNGTASGSALVWVSYAGEAWGQGELRAYAAVPDSVQNLDIVYEDSYGASSKFVVPGVGAGSIYIGTSDGYVVGYGSPASVPIQGGPLQFGNVVTGRSSTMTLVLTATQATTVTALVPSSTVFTAGASTPPLPATLAAGQTLSLPVTFSPTQGEQYVAGLDVTTSTVTAAITLEGTSVAAAAKLASAPPAESFGGIAIDSSMTVSLILTNQGNAPYTFSTTVAPSAPFSVTGTPAAGQMLPPGGNVAVSVTFAPTALGMFTDSVQFFGTSGKLSVYLSGTSATPGVLTITPLALDYGTVAVGSKTTLTFIVQNTGDLPLTITKSKPPDLGVFNATTALPEGQIILPGAMVTESVTFEPTVSGSFGDEWALTSTGTGGLQEVTFSGVAGSGAPVDAGAD